MGEVIKGVGEVRGAIRGSKRGGEGLWGGLDGDELVKGYGDTQIGPNEVLGVINEQGLVRGRSLRGWERSGET